MGPRHTQGHRQAPSSWALGGDMLAGGQLASSSGPGPGPRVGKTGAGSQRQLVAAGARALGP